MSRFVLLLLLTTFVFSTLGKDLHGWERFRRQLDFATMLNGLGAGGLGGLATTDASGSVDGGLPTFTSLLSSFLAPGSPLESFFGGGSGLENLFGGGLTGGQTAQPDYNTGELPVNPDETNSDLPTIPPDNNYLPATTPSSLLPGIPGLSGLTGGLSGLSGLASGGLGGLGSGFDLNSFSTIFGGKRK